MRNRLADVVGVGNAPVAGASRHVQCVCSGWPEARLRQGLVPDAVVGWDWPRSTPSQSWFGCVCAHSEFDGGQPDADCLTPQLRTNGRLADGMTDVKLCPKRTQPVPSPVTALTG
jgi:hypothetical protein